MWKQTPKVERITPRVNLTIPKVMLIIQQVRRTVEFEQALGVPVPQTSEKLMDLNAA